ncbi:unnamed protein product [Ophioblennius macclurei]
MKSGCKNKKRVVLPSRPEPPSVEQMLEDMDRATPQDPVFSVLDSAHGPRPIPDATRQRFEQARRLLELGERLRDSCGQLRLQRVELEGVACTLFHDITEVESQTQ